jgi:AcrR family transcriptional regulator
MVVTGRKSKEVRREEILDAALLEFAERGLHGASTEDIARRAGISQPYVFRLFGTKKALFTAVVNRCFRETHELFARAAEGKRGREALEAMGHAYVERLQTDRTALLGQMQAYAACDDPEIRDVVRNGYGDLVAYVERVAGDLPAAAVSEFFARGMLLNVIASMGFGTNEPGQAWVDRLVEGIKPE